MTKDVSIPLTIVGILNGTEHGGLDAAPGHRARDRTVGSDDHGGAGWTRRGLDRADDGGDAGRASGLPDRQQLVEHISHAKNGQPYQNTIGGLTPSP